MAGDGGRGAAKAAAGGSGPREQAGPWTLDQVGARVARDVAEGWLVNVGVGWPQAAVPHLAATGALLHSENGIIGLGPPPPEGQGDPDLVDAGKAFATVVPGGAFVDSATSFVLIRGGRLDLALMGAYEVSAAGDLANWRLTGRRAAGIGGAADLACGARRVWVLTGLFTADGEPKLVAACRHPLTARAVVRRVYTDHGVFEPAGEGFAILDLAPGIHPDGLRARGVPLAAAAQAPAPS